MRSKAVLVIALMLALTLAGCSGGGKKKAPEVILPPEITEQDIGRLANLASKFPTAFTFAGQAALEPVTVWFNDSLAAGTGTGGIEMPNDNGPTDYGSEVVSFDVSEHVPVDQPVEVRINLKWLADPGRAADLDIWVDMPGEKGASDLGRFDESNNWNIVNKIRVVDSIHLEGQPFMVGVQVNNGRIFDPAGEMPFSLRVDFHFVANVLPPATPYALQVPENSTLLIIDTERVIGDEHVVVDFVVVGPGDNRVWSMHHNDIGTETLSISIDGGGEYILYAQHMHGGFLRVEAEIPNEDHVARQLELTVDERILHQGPAAAPGTYAEQGGPSSNTFGDTGTFDTGATFPLDVIPFVTTTAGNVDVAINITAPGGWLVTMFGRGTYEDERGRIGSPLTTRYTPGRETMDQGSYSYGIVSNSAGTSLGVRILSYTR